MGKVFSKFLFSSYNNTKNRKKLILFSSFFQEITSQVNDHGCSIPFIYNNTLQYDCVLDPNWYSSYFCFTIPENDGDADHFLDCSDVILFIIIKFFHYYH